MSERAFMIEASEYDVESLLASWRWRVPRELTPLFLSALGDWVFGAPDGSLWALSMLDGECIQIARDKDEYNHLKRSEAWLDETFAAGWVVIARGHGMVPTKYQCLGWRAPPRLGGSLEAANLEIHSMLVWQALMGQLHEALDASSGPRPPDSH